MIDFSKYIKILINIKSENGQFIKWFKEFEYINALEESLQYIKMNEINININIYNVICFFDESQPIYNKIFSYKN